MTSRDTHSNSPEKPEVKQRAELATELTAELDDGRHYSVLAYETIGGERQAVEVTWNHAPDHGGAGYPRNDFTDRSESERHRKLAIDEVGEPDSSTTATSQTRPVADGGDPRLIDICWSDGIAPDNQILHRDDDEAACAHRPTPNPTTDLATAAVGEGNELCSRCDWPDGSSKVLERAG